MLENITVKSWLFPIQKKSFQHRQVDVADPSAIVNPQGDLCIPIMDVNLHNLQLLNVLNGLCSSCIEKRQGCAAVNSDGAPFTNTGGITSFREGNCGKVGIVEEDN